MSNAVLQWFILVLTAAFLSLNMSCVDSFGMMQSENQTYFKGHIQCGYEIFLYLLIITP
jgi:hypothetical protein